MPPSYIKLSTLSSSSRLSVKVMRRPLFKNANSCKRVRSTLKSKIVVSKISASGLKITVVPVSVASPITVRGFFK